MVSMWFHFVSSVLGKLVLTNVLPNSFSSVLRQDRCDSQSVDVSGMLLLSATSFFELTNPQFDSAGNFSRPLRTRQFESVDLLLARPLIRMLDNSDLAIHDLSPAWW